jgi:hypothetical protein
MANLQHYTLAHIYLNSQLLTEEAEVRLTRNSNAQRVNTVYKGFAGVSSGPAITELECTNAVPAAGFEYPDLGKNILGNDIIEATLLAAGTTYTFKGFLMTDNFSHSTGAESKLSFTAIGQFSDWL